MVAYRMILAKVGFDTRLYCAVAIIPVSHHSPGAATNA